MLDKSFKKSIKSTLIYLVWLVLGNRGSKGAVSNLVLDMTAAGISASLPNTYLHRYKDILQSFHIITSIRNKGKRIRLF